MAARRAVARGFCGEQKIASERPSKSECVSSPGVLFIITLLKTTFKIDLCDNLVFLHVKNIGYSHL